MTSLILLRKSYERKRRFNLYSNDMTSLGTAIKNLLYTNNPQHETDLYHGKDPIPSLNVLSTLPTNPQNDRQ